MRFASSPRPPSPQPGGTDPDHPGRLGAAGLPARQHGPYKWSYKLAPLVGSDLVLDCLRLAADARELDMRASPYDLSAFGFDPIRVEDPAGRAEYVRRQSVVAQRAAPLRAALLERCEQLETAATAQEGTLLTGKLNGLS